MKNKSYFIGLLNAIAVDAVLTISFVFTTCFVEKEMLSLKILFILLPFLTLLFFRDTDYLYLIYKRFLINLFFVITISLILAVLIGMNYLSVTNLENIGLDLVQIKSTLISNGIILTGDLIKKLSDNSKFTIYIFYYLLLILENIVIAFICYISVPIRNKRINNKMKKKYKKSL